jgi:hypothetical protein
MITRFKYEKPAPIHHYRHKVYSANQLTKKFIKALQKGKVAKLEKKLKRFHTLEIIDIHQFQSRLGTQSMVANIVKERTTPTFLSSMTTKEEMLSKSDYEFSRDFKHIISEAEEFEPQLF